MDTNSAVLRMKSCMHCMPSAYLLGAPSNVFRRGGRTVGEHVQEKGIDEAFWPLYELDEQPEEGKGSHWFVRIAMALALVGTVWALHVYVPDKAGASLQPAQSL